MFPLSLCRYQTHSVWFDWRKEHQRRRPQAGSGLGTGSLKSPPPNPDCRRTREYQKNLALKSVCPTPTSRGRSLGYGFKGCNRSTTSHWCFGSFTWVAFHCVAASAPTVGGAVVCVSVQSLITLTLFFFLFCDLIPDTPLVMFLCKHQLMNLRGEQRGTSAPIVTDTTLWYSFVVCKPCQSH